MLRYRLKSTGKFTGRERERVPEGPERADSLIKFYRSFWGRFSKIFSNGMHGKWSQSSNFWDFVSSSSAFSIESMTVSDAIFLGIEAHLRFHSNALIRNIFVLNPYQWMLKRKQNAGPSASAFSGKKSERSIETSEWKPPWIFLIFLNDTVIIHSPSNIRFQFSADRFVPIRKLRFC